MILFIAILVFLFTLFILSTDDFVFMRKNISQITLFDIAIVSGLIGLFFSRLTYASLHPSFAYFNPLVFFVVPYFPGLSLSGFLIGSCLSVYLFTMKGKLPTGRIFDVMTLSLFPATVVFFLWEGAGNISTKHMFSAVVYLIAAFVFSLYFFFFKNFLAKSPWKDGTMSILSLGIFSLLQFMIVMTLEKFKTIPLETAVFAFFLGALFISLLIKKSKRL